MVFTVLLLYHCQVVKVIEVQCLQYVPILILECPDDGCYGEVAQIGQHSLPSLSRGQTMVDHMVQTLDDEGRERSPKLRERLLLVGICVPNGTLFPRSRSRVAQFKGNRVPFGMQQQFSRVFQGVQFQNSTQMEFKCYTV